MARRMTPPSASIRATRWMRPLSNRTTISSPSNCKPAARAFRRHSIPLLTRRLPDQILAEHVEAMVGAGEHFLFEAVRPTDHPSDHRNSARLVAALVTE